QNISTKSLSVAFRKDSSQTSRSPKLYQTIVKRLLLFPASEICLKRFDVRADLSARVIVRRSNAYGESSKRCALECGFRFFPRIKVDVVPFPRTFRFAAWYLERPHALKCQIRWVAQHAAMAIH